MLHKGPLSQILHTHLSPFVGFCSEALKHLLGYCWMDLEADILEEQTQINE